MIRKWEERIAEMDRREVEEIAIGEPPFAATVNRREVMNTLAALRGEPPIEWGIPKIEERERVGLHRGTGVIPKPGGRWAVYVWINGVQRYGGRFGSKGAAEEAARRLRKEHGSFRRERTHCDRGHLMTADNTVVTRRPHRQSPEYACRKCRNDAQRRYREQKKAERNALRKAA